MRRSRLLAATLLLGFTIVTPALAGQRGYFRGHRVAVRDRVVVGAHAPFFAPRPRFGVSFAFGLPGFYAGYYGPAYDPPAPVYYAPPIPIVAAPVYCEPVWIPGHYVWSGGARFWIAGRWSR